VTCLLRELSPGAYRRSSDDKTFISSPFEHQPLYEGEGRISEINAVNSLARFLYFRLQAGTSFGLG
jgi:hypothetical protein